MKRSIRFWLSCGIALCSYLAISPTQAQPVPDATLPNNSIVTNQGNISTITGGTRAGLNLFHSFSEFSVPTNGIAHFNNALDIQNIISRVTGGSISNIDGLIRANGTANLFLINPNGIIFGRNATLAIGGEFVGSTASSLNFADGTKFSATAQSTKPLLTVSVPIGLQFGGTEGSILNESQATDSNRNSVGLQVYPGKTLALVGGRVSLDGGKLKAPGGRVELGGLSGAGTVGLKSDGSLSFPQGVQRADVSLTNGSVVDVVAQSGGRIAINAQNINISKASYLDAGIGKGLGSVASQAGDIELSAQGAIDIVNSSLFNNVESGAVGKGGSINITAGSLSLKDGAQLNAGTSGQGDAGSVTITARDAITFDGVGSGGPSGAIVNVERGAMGNGGDIKVTAGSLKLTNGGVLGASTFGHGDAGNVTITARDAITFDGVNRGFVSAAFSFVAPEAVGKGGNIDVTAGSLSLTSGAEISARTYNKGDAGSVTITVRDAVNLNTPTVDYIRVLVALPASVVDNFRLIVQGCQARGGKPTSRFVNTGRGGLPPNPYEAQGSSEVWRDVQLPRELAENSTGVSRTSTSPTMNPDRLVEATGWIVDENGNVELVAKMPTAISQERCGWR